MRLLISTLLALPLLAGGHLRDGTQFLRLKDNHLSLRFSRHIYASAQTGVDPRESVSSVHAALDNAVRTWLAASQGAVSIETGSTDSGTVGDGVVTFTDPTPFDTGLCNQFAVACTIVTYIPGSGQIQSADIAFNPQYRHSSLGFPQTFDIGAVMLHELGHAQGLDHSGLYGTVMNPFVENGSSLTDSVFQSRQLATDDVITLLSAYGPPDPSLALAFVSGAARLGGAPIAGGHVVALTPGGTPAGDSVTGSDGAYSIALPAGTYTLVLRPLIDPLLPSDLGFYGVPSPPFPTVFWTAAGGDPLNADSLALEGGATLTGLDFAVTPGDVSNLGMSGLLQPDGYYEITTSPTALPRGSNYYLVVQRTAISGTPKLWSTAPGISLLGDTQLPAPDDPGLMLQKISVSPDAVPGAYTLLYTNGISTALLPGVLRVITNPVVTAISDAASSQPAATYSPGQMIAISGSDFTVSEQTAGEGALPTQLGSLSVRIGDRFAPLLSVSPSLIQAQIPAEIPSGPADLTVVTDVQFRTQPIQITIQ